MSEQSIIAYAAPTLANLKCASLFNAKFTDINVLKDEIRTLNHLYRKKGLCFILLRVKKQTALIYVCRPAKLLEILADPAVQAFLMAAGYRDLRLGACLCVLMAHLKTDAFPHEIGVFLGYPLEDVQAFIENKGRNFKCAGMWKVYTDEGRAKKLFALYKSCSQFYCQCFACGFTLSELTAEG